MAERRLLILGGTSEAAALAARAVKLPGLHVITSLAGRTEQPASIKGEVRTGGLGGTAGLGTYLGDAKIDLVVDATHPFAAVISRHAAEACRKAGISRLLLVRPPWQPQPSDRWFQVETLQAAAMAALDAAHRLFLTVGRQELGTFADLESCWSLVRLIEPPTQPLALARYKIVTGRGPFVVEDERRLMTTHRIEALVSKNSGGEATYAKIAAARALGLPVIMVKRPPLPDGPRVADVDAALEWISAHLP